MILSFKNKLVEHLFNNERVKRFEAFEQVARRKLDMLNAASSLRDLKAPPSNHLEQLKGKLHPQYSVRINDQWRLVFLWVNNNAQEVDIIDYH